MINLSEGDDQFSILAHLTSKGVLLPEMPGSNGQLSLCASSSTIPVSEAPDNHLVGTAWVHSSEPTELYFASNYQLTNRELDYYGEIVEQMQFIYHLDGDNISISLMDDDGWRVATGTINGNQMFVDGETFTLIVPH